MMAVARVALHFMCVLLLGGAPRARAACPVNLETDKRCSGHGSCNEKNQCACDPGFDGADCGRKQCAKGPVWTYEKLDYRECSDRGLCLLGECACHPSWTGKACERLACSADCHGRGRCVSLGQYYHEMGNFLPYTAWDKDVLQGCRCNTPHNGLGPEGFDCQFFACPRGDDPLTAGQVNEKQLILCNAPSGHFSVRFPSNNDMSQPIQWDDDAAALRRKIEGLGIREVKVTFTAGATRVCHDDLENVISVEFMQDFGPLEPLLVDTSEIPDDGVSDVKLASKGVPLGVVASVDGTKENKACSGRGLCDNLLGECLCYIVPMPGYRSSDGYGNPGDRGDCGAADDHKHLGNVNAGPTLCPGEIACSGHGVCTGAPELRCRCSEGWTSGDCSLRSCPKGWPWFPTDYFSIKTIGRLKKREKPPFAECSNRGVCDINKGECRCQLGFSGAACQIMEICPSDTAAPCNGHGTCQSALQQFQDAGKKDADFAAQWDDVTNAFSHHAWVRYRYGEALHTCSCDDGFGGYDCSLRLCPYGDDPDHPGRQEVQLLECQADAGSFTLRYGVEETRHLYPNSTAADVKAALEALNAVGSVDVVFSGAAGGHTACHASANGTNVIKVTFHDYYYHYKGGIGVADVLYGKDPSLPTLVPLVNGSQSAGAGVAGTLGLGDASLAVNGTVRVAAKGAALYDAWSADGVLLLGNASVLLDGTWGFGATDGNNRPFTARFHGVFGAGFTTTLHDHGVDRVVPVTPFFESQAGTRAHLECSGRGVCDYASGACLCFKGYASSDGFGNRGRLPDCGHAAQFQNAF